jgi:L-fuconolactonase
LPAPIDLARVFPETTIVLNRLGAPLGIGSYASIKDEVFAVWRKSIKEMATCPNVFIKLGGSAMHMFGFGWEHRAFSPSSDELVASTGHIYREAIDCFSLAQCILGGNFPVEKERCLSIVLWNSFKKIAAGSSSDELSDLLLNSAARAYRLGRSTVASSRGLSWPD